MFVLTSTNSNHSFSEPQTRRLHLLYISLSSNNCSDAAKKSLLILTQIFEFSNRFFSTFRMTDPSQIVASNESSQMAATPVSDSFPVPPCVPRTHTSPAIIQMLKNLPLISILQMNKDIEIKNAERSLKTFHHTSDPTAYLEPGSDEASLISLEDTDLNHFRIPSFAASFPNLIYSWLAKWIADEEIKDKLKLKRKTADKSKFSAEDARIAKRRCMNGQKMVPWVVGVPWQATFPQNLFDTELCIAVPLPFFLNKNLNILNVEASTLATMKTNPNPGETKGNIILDIDNLSVCFGPVRAPNILQCSTPSHSSH
jgi:hypothetical protein